MDGDVDLIELLRQIQLVSYFADPGNYSEVPNISGHQLSPLPTTYYTLPGRYFQQNHVADLETQLRSTLVGTILLLALSCL